MLIIISIIISKGGSAPLPDGTWGVRGFGLLSLVEAQSPIIYVLLRCISCLLQMLVS
jgi:hypothetical protein